MKIEKKQILSALVIIAFGLVVSLAGFRAENTGSAENTESADTSENMADTLDMDQSSSADVPENSDDYNGMKIDFERLKEQNSDIYAWITVPGTEIDYPVLQKSDTEDPYDNYYLDHQADLSEGFPGVIYSQPVNHRDFTDAVTVLYGHNLKSGEMFSSLHFFEDKGFFDQNSLIIIYTPEKTFTYEIYAAIDFSDALLPYEYDFTKSTEVQRHLVDVRNCEGNFREETKLSEGARILVLSTCYSDKADRRLLVEAVLTEELTAGLPEE